MTTDDWPEEDDEPLPTHVAFDGIEYLIPPTWDGGQGRIARAFGFHRRSISRWKRAGRIPFHSADKALARIGEHPIVFWPESYGLPPTPVKPPVPSELTPSPKPAPKISGTRRSHNATPYEARLPPGVVHDSASRVLIAVVELHRRNRGSITLTEVMEETGLGRAGVWHHLKSLRDAGLVDWVDNRAGTLRPLVKVVAL